MIECFIFESSIQRSMTWSYSIWSKMRVFSFAQQN